MPLINEYLILLFLYIVTCLWVIQKYYKRKLGVFQVPFIFSLASVLMMTPQFCVIIYNTHYDPNLLWDLTYCMITSTLALSFGWDKAQDSSIYSCRDIDLVKSKNTFLALFLIGLYCAIQSYLQVVAHFLSDQSDIRTNHTYQILLFFMLYFDIGMFYALTYIIRGKKASKIIYFILIISSIYYLYIILMLARRTLVVKLFMSLGILVAMLKPRWQKAIKIIIILFFTTGTIYQASIALIRGNLRDNKEEKEQIDIWENYKQSYISPNLVHGMDLGNAALFIKHAKDNSTYTFGLSFWDDIVTWYFPSFIFGKQGKEDLKLAGTNDKYITSVTHNVTTQTGYYEAFEAFWYLGFILFYIFGYIFGYVWKRIGYSSLYLIVYLCFMFHIPSLASHGFSFVVGPGIGTMTQILCENAREVVAVEIDKKLIPILTEDTLSYYDNVTVINEDILKLDIKKLADEKNGGRPIKVVANLPYYITTPIIMGLFESHVPLDSITIMVQKEVADRMQCGPGTKDYGALSLAVQFYARPKVVLNVPASCFMPRPNVDSAVIRLERFKTPPVDVKNEHLMFKIIRASFNQRRKTMLNSVGNSGIGITKEDLTNALETMGLPLTIRGEALTLEQFAELSNLLV